MRGWWIANVFVLLFAPWCDAQAPNPAALSRQAVSAYQAKDYASFLALEKQLLALAPGDTRTIYNVACGEALAGHASEAVRLLEQLLTFKMDLSADTDPDLAGIHNTPEWKLYAEHLATLRQPLVRSSVAFVLPEKGLLATSLAVDEASGDTYIASGRERKVVRRTKNGAVSDFATEKDGLLGVWNLLLDPVRKQLVVSTAALPFMRNFKKEDLGKSGICIFDLASGKLLRKAFLDSGQHFLTATVMDRSGNIFVVDSAAAEIYRLRRASSELELFISSMVFHAPKGLALSEDQQTMYVSDFNDGIWAVEVLSNDRRHLAGPPNETLSGLDGLTRVSGGFIAVEAAVKPYRVLRLKLDAKVEAIASVETLESNHPDYMGPVQGIVSGDDYLYIADSQFGLVNQKTGEFDNGKATATTVLRLPLNK